MVNSASEAAGNKGSVPFFYNQAEQVFVHVLLTKLITGNRKTRDLPVYVCTCGHECTWNNKKNETCC